MTLKVTPLHAAHEEAGGKMVDFAGWHMPVQYKSTLKEHLAVRSSVGLFDVSHMGQIEVTGPNALEAVQHVTCNDLSRIQDGQAQYTAFLTESGTFIDDVVVYRLGSDRIFICINAANTDKDYAWVRERIGSEAKVSDVSADFAQIAVQGPLSGQVLQSLTSLDLATIRYYWFQHGQVNGRQALISRTGYTGEDGFEIYLAPEFAEEVWNSLLRNGADAGVVPAGLAARNTLRLEVCFPLYGNDIDESTTPLEAGLGWIVKLKKSSFVGQEALLEQKARGVERKLVGFEMVDRGIARDHYPVYYDGRPFGEVRSGSYGPAIQRNVGLTYLPAEASTVESRFEVEVRGKRLQAKVVKRPFYKRVHN